MAHHNEPNDRRNLDPDSPQEAFDPTTDAEKLQADELEDPDRGPLLDSPDEEDGTTDAQKLEADGLQGRRDAGDTLGE